MSSLPLLPHRICLLECSVREVRVVVATILEKTLESALHFQDQGVDSLLDVLLSLLDKDVPENCKNCSQYFSLFSNFVLKVRTRESITALTFIKNELQYFVPEREIGLDDKIMVDEFHNFFGIMLPK